MPHHAPGYAPAVQPVSETTIHTGVEGLSADVIRYPVSDGDLPAYYAMPFGRERCPTVLVVQEIFGIHEYIRDVCRRLARRGYLAIAPELYARQGDVLRMNDRQEIMSQVVSRVPDAQVLADLDAAADYAARSGWGDPARLGLTGFCWGGRVAWLYAAHGTGLKAAVAWYGRLEGAADDLRPRHPLDIAGRLNCPVLGLYGGRDESIPLSSIERMRAAVRETGKNAEIVLYPEAGHGFHADYRPGYNRNAAEDGWRRMLDWLKSYGVA
ncbi:MAG: dienelactone hydrolase family protein [Acidobacteriia bacterium]|nr:dienelactone hydrolase family protein [Terriglobia bacterium]